MKNKILLTIFSLVLFSLNITNCTEIIGKVKERELFIVEAPCKNYKLSIVFYPSNATIQASIQVKRKYNNKKEVLLSNYERYNFVDTFYFKSTNTFVLLIRDTASKLGNKSDTMLINLD